MELISNPRCEVCGKMLHAWHFRVTCPVCGAVHCAECGEEFNEVSGCTFCKGEKE